MSALCLFADDVQRGNTGRYSITSSTITKSDTGNAAEPTRPVHAALDSAGQRSPIGLGKKRRHEETNYKE
jgi:hypothetical protein